MNKDNRTDEELNRIIAEWCGWVPSDGDHKRRNAWLEIAGEDWPIRPPNYCRDLNAVHEAEKRILGDLLNMWDKYCELLGGSLYHCAHADASQRAEALVKVIEEGKK